MGTTITSFEKSSLVIFATNFREILQPLSETDFHFKNRREAFNTLIIVKI